MKKQKTVQRDVRRLSADLLAPVLKTDAQKLYGILPAADALSG